MDTLRTIQGAIGIIAEYDPFHLGHQYHIQETKRCIGEDAAVVCVMSGNWVQRGTCALTDKWTRAELALRGGVDLVLELPIAYTLSSAEGFARGAVELLAHTGVVQTLSFGCACTDVEKLRQTALCLDSDTYQEELRRMLKKGFPFARCRQETIRKLLGEETAQLLTDPNNNLGIEYLRALHAQKSSLQPVAILRRGALHNTPCPKHGFASASYLRGLLTQGAWTEAAAWMPAGAGQILQQAGLANLNDVERAILARLRSMQEEDFTRLPDSGSAEGLPARLVRAAQRSNCLEEFYALAKTKRYTYARLRRLTIRAFLELPAENTPVPPQYLRVLGMNERGKQVLKAMKTVSSLPILTKCAHIHKLSTEAKQQFEAERRATDLYALCFDPVRPCGLDYTAGPVILEDGR